MFFSKKLLKILNATVASKQSYCLITIFKYVSKRDYDGHIIIFFFYIIRYYKHNEKQLSHLRVAAVTQIIQSRHKEAVIINNNTSN
ncbi:hypothetical protein RclHR1_03200003 [Rhizophagus clarus]|uniref:Uncharacterized protein n=1 Tax=Rhizophagus clarus TaxID=94130 RepID=A0A2Z6R7Z8_9GLOM|nr:hypothetical protein RclHR1_03200003 [Rhizophagus clarus]GES97316.1 hypothetical protein RCL_jg7191.t1 [Rhizophagus clarus]